MWSCVLIVHFVLQKKFAITLIYYGIYEYFVQDSFYFKFRRTFRIYAFWGDRRTITTILIFKLILSNFWQTSLNLWLLVKRPPERSIRSCSLARKRTIGKWACQAWNSARLLQCNGLWLFRPHTNMNKKSKAV